ncbi:hypothetical protein NEICINOT_04362 [Neisseria cinerea ATCC 14685]|uniref:Uncharacterized protein n=1 Tax=Neisseria cinerea ATCC 14685 TaxID=546262 RepID=D0W3X1_NEICI|nr:hypothetical protein NEICINOT_04362 [Neisseria cinerea ATCC 14685]
MLLYVKKRCILKEISSPVFFIFLYADLKQNTIKQINKDTTNHNR